MSTDIIIIIIIIISVTTKPVDCSVDYLTIYINIIRRLHDTRGAVTGVSTDIVTALLSCQSVNNLDVAPALLTALNNTRTDRWTDGQIDREIHRGTGGQTGRQTDMHRH